MVAEYIVSALFALERTVGELLDRCSPLLAATDVDELRGLLARMCAVGGPAYRTLRSLGVNMHSK